MKLLRCVSLSPTPLSPKQLSNLASFNFKYKYISEIEVTRDAATITG